MSTLLAYGADIRGALVQLLFTLEIGIAIRLGSIAIFGRGKELPECNCKFRVVV
jgi:hypothetical protein